MRSAHHLLSFAAILAALCVPGSAQSGTLVFGSYIGNTPAPGLSNTPTIYNNTSGSGTVGLAYDSVDLNAYTGQPVPSIQGSTYITYMQGAGAPAGITTYTTTYTGNLSGYTGVLSLIADDVATVTLNGVQIGATLPTQYNTVMTYNIPANVYVNGLNTLVVTVNNLGGYTGVDFQATAVPPAVSPACTAPTQIVANPTLPTTQVVCPLLPRMNPITTDGNIFAVVGTASNVVMQYCVGTACNPAVIYFAGPVLVSPTSAMLGGNPSPQGGTGTLYIQSDLIGTNEVMWAPASQYKTIAPQ